MDAAWQLANGGSDVGLERTEMRVTRGHGLLEEFLAGQRARRANSLIPQTARSGRILDVGCGSYPAFLLNTRFEERYGIDRVALPSIHDSRVRLIEHDIANDPGLPFDDSFFEVVTMLAVFEHIEARPLRRLLQEVRRVLCPGGTLVMTTPLRWTEGILRVMSRLNLVSREEIREHKAQYSHGQVVDLLVEAGFARAHIRRGTFELGMNLWVAATKGP